VTSRRESGKNDTDGDGTAGRRTGGRESKAERLARMHAEYDILREVYPEAYCALHFHNPFELLVATVLSAQTTDKRVNSVTPELFERYPDPAAMWARPPRPPGTLRM